MNKSCTAKLESSTPYKGLETRMEKGCHGQKPLIFLHPSDYGATHVSPALRNYTEEELKALEKRDFETRLFLTADTYEGDSVWLRTHWTDNHIHKTVFNSVRDYFKAVHSTENFTAAKAVLSEMLTTCLEVERTNYYSFAITMASALSNMGKNVSFQIHDSLITSENELPLAQRKLCLTMHLLFTKVKTARFLYSGKACNIYRLIHCKTVVSKIGKRDLLVPWFTFFLQTILTIFVILNVVLEEGWGIQVGSKGNFVLAFTTFVYSAVVASPGLAETADAYRMYGKLGPIQVLDFIINSVLPFILLVFGATVSTMTWTHFDANFNYFECHLILLQLILSSKTYIDAVLNTAALLFIPEIDDDLPGLLGYNQETIVKNYLVNNLLEQFDYFCLMKDEVCTDRNIHNINDVIGIQFCDYYLTHWPEQGSTHDESIHFQPHEVDASASGDLLGHQVNPVNSVNENCLIRKIVWGYTTGFEYSIKPRIAYLRLEMMNGKVVEINMKTVDNEVGVDDVYHELEGAYIITAFQMSSSVLRLRICGSKYSEDFLKAFEYYSLWDINCQARRLLRRFHQHEMKISGVQDFFNME